MAGMPPFARAPVEVAQVQLGFGLEYASDVSKFSTSTLSEVSPRLFGITAYEGVEDFYATTVTNSSQGVDMLQDWGVTGPVGFGGEFKWVLPQDGERPMSEADIRAWFASGNASRLFFTYNSSDRYVYGKALPTIAKAGLENFKYLLGVVPGDTYPHDSPRNGTLWGVLAAEYMKLCRKADPSLQLFHLTNEPNAHWWQDDLDGSFYGSFFNNASAVIRAEVNTSSAPVLLGGPVLCWPPVWPPSQAGQKPWYTWQEWSRPVLDAVLPQGSMDWFDFHAYNISAAEMVASMHVVAAYSASYSAATGVGPYVESPLPSAVTEHNWRLTAEQWGNYSQHFLLRAVPNLQAVTAMAKYPETAVMLQTFDYSANLSPTNGRFKGTSNLTVTPMMDLFKTLQPWRGRVLPVIRSSAAPAQLEIAASMTNTTLTLLFANLDANQQAAAASVVLQFRNAAPSCSFPSLDATLTAASATLLSVAGRKAASVPAVDYDESTHAATVSLPAMAASTLLVATYTLSTPVPATAHITQSRRFGPSVMMPLTWQGSAAQPVTVTVSGFPRHNTTAGTSCFLPSLLVRFGPRGPATTGTWTVACIDGCDTSFAQNITLAAPGALADAPFPSTSVSGNNVTLQFNVVVASGSVADTTAPSYLSFVEVTQRYVCCGG